MPDSAIMETRHLSFAYGRHQAIDDVTLSLRPACFHGLVGPNGSGKTTLLDLLLGLKSPRQGAALYQNRPVLEYGRRELARHLALVPQEFAVNFAFSVREVILMGRHPYMRRLAGPSEADLDLVDQATELMDLTSLMDKTVTDLSSGEKQRVALARALVQNTPVLLLDEPTSNLDISHALKVLHVAADLVKQGRTVVAVLHDLNLAAAFCQELVLLKNGRVQAVGPTDQVLTPERLQTTFDVEAAVEVNDYSGRLAVSYRF